MASTDEQDPGFRPSHRIDSGNALALPNPSTVAEDPLEAASTVAIDVSTLASLRNHPPMTPPADPERTTTFRPVTLRTAPEHPPSPSPLERMKAAAHLEGAVMLGASVPGHGTGSRTMALPQEDRPPLPEESASTTTFDARSIRQGPPHPPTPPAPTMLGREQMRVPPPPLQAMAMPCPPAAPMMPLPVAPPPMAPYASVSMPSAPTVSRRSMGVLVVVLLLACVAVGAGGGIWLAG